GMIAPQWEDILRFVATIKLKEATTSQLFKRLNSYARQHPLYVALKEFGRIPKSDFLLRYIDLVDLRQTVEKQLNKGENVHKFSRAVSPLAITKSSSMARSWSRRSPKPAGASSKTRLSVGTICISHSRSRKRRVKSANEN